MYCGVDHKPYTLLRYQVVSVLHVDIKINAWSRSSVNQQINLIQWILQSNNERTVKVGIFKIKRSGRFSVKFTVNIELSDRYNRYPAQKFPDKIGLSMKGMYYIDNQKFDD